MNFLKPGDDSRRNWKKINELEAARRLHAAALGMSEDDYGRLRSTPRLPDLHPFKTHFTPRLLTALSNKYCRISSLVVIIVLQM